MENSKFEKNILTQFVQDLRKNKSVSTRPLKIILLFNLIILVLMIFFLYLNQANWEKKTRANSYSIANELAESFRSLLGGQIRVYSNLADLKHNIFPDDHAAYQALAKMIIASDPTIAAVNWIDQDFTIRWVYPLIPNQAAQGRKITEHPEISQSVLEQMRQGKYAFTPIIKTFQGYDGFILYLPLGADFKKVGWINVIMDYQTWFNQFFKNRRLDEIYVKFTWQESPQSFYEFGQKPTHEELYQHDFDILNQKISIQLAHDEPVLANFYSKTRLVAAGVVIFSLLVIWLLYLLYRDQQRMYLLQQAILLKNAVITSVGHDMAGPLQLLSSGCSVLEADRSSKIGMDAINKAFDALNSIVKTVRKINKVGLNEFKLELESCQLDLLVNDALAIVKPLAEAKKIKLLNQVEPGFTVKAHCSSLVHHVINNLVHNSIKFSHPNSQVILSARKENDYIVLDIVDWGIGFKQQQLKSLFVPNKNISTLGTENESGSGLGLIQVNFFMHAYGGKISITSPLQDQSVEANPPSTVVSLFFIKGD
jgi:signal transduction histidine kinase/sensor domain CHASE-containing protein